MSVHLKVEIQFLFPGFIILFLFLIAKTLRASLNKNLPHITCLRILNPENFFT